MANFKDVLTEALKRGHAQTMFSVNRGLMEIAKSTKKKPAFVKVAVDDESAIKFMNGSKYAGFLICFDGDVLNSIRDELDKNSDTTESAQRSGGRIKSLSR